ncbi:PD40 domain-containing protein [Cryobacterium algoricola]|nr:PD40 domain-containing protein [Cryobacterium algoricola]
MMNKHATTKYLMAGVLLAVSVSGCATAPPGAPSSAMTAQAASVVVRDGDEWLVFQGAQDCGLTGMDPSSICLMSPDGSGRHKLVDQDGELLHPDWSPDGTRIAFSTGQEIWTAAVDGSEVTKVAECSSFPGCNGVDYPAWSPDGTTMALTIYNGRNLPMGPPSTSAIALVDLESGEAKTIAQTEPLELVDQARWSHDGTRLAVQVEHFDATGKEIGGAIGIVPAVGGVPKAITDFSLFATYPDWDPECDRIVFTTNEFNPAGGPVDLYLVGADGTDLAPLIYDGSDAQQSKQPSWTPDGKGVLFVQWQARSVTYVNADGSGVRKFGGLGTHPRLRPVG